jgi:hypothetical protein
MKTLAIVGLVLIAMAGCRPEPDAYRLFDELVVSTNYDINADFGAYTTYSISTDTIGFVTNTNPDDTIITQGESSYPRPILDRIISNMNQLGFSKVGRTENPDLRINVYVVNDFNLFQEVVYPNYYYPSYYGYGYGYGSYYGYPYINTYASNTGSLVVEMLDLKNITVTNTVKVIWSAYMGDVYSTIDLIKQSEEAISQAFVQSPYLSN